MLGGGTGGGENVLGGGGGKQVRHLLQILNTAWELEPQTLGKDTPGVGDSVNKGMEVGKSL